MVQGFQDAGDSLFPEQSTHLAAPGLRLVSGNYRGLGLLAGSELYLFARDADDETGELFVMRYARPEPCKIPAVARFSATREPTRSAPLISYFTEDVRRGTLRFADAACKTYELTFEDARLPVGETERGVVVWAGDELWLAAPETGSQERLASGVNEVIRNVFGKRSAVRANGSLKVFDSSWQLQASFGREVTTVLRAGQSLFFLDAEGLHRVVEGKAKSEVVEDREAFVSDACSLASRDGTWITLRSPCDGGDVMALHEPSGKLFTLPFDANPKALELVPARGGRGRDPLSDPFWFFYLRSDAEAGTEDALFVRTPAGKELALGANATLEQLRLIESDSEAYGYALVDVDGETGRYLWWSASGETRVLSESAMWRPDRLIVNFDGVLGDAAVVSGDRLRVLAERVPPDAFEFRDEQGEWTVLFHDVNGAGAGKLSAFPNGLDELDATPEDAPLELPQLAQVASNVIALGTSSLGDVLSGVIYLTDYDLAKRTGRLVYRNQELRFSAGVNDGVSDYLVSHDEVLYTIPYGEDAGIWLVSGK